MTTNQKSVVEHIQKKLIELSILEISIPDWELSVEYKLRIKPDAKIIHLNFQSSFAEGTIGIWFVRESMDISVWETQEGEALYEFHNIISDWNEVNSHVDKAIEAFLKA